MSTRDRIAQLLVEGLPRRDIAERLGLARSTVSYHARRLGAPMDARCARRYDWAAVQAFHDAGRGMLECPAHFGFARQAWSDAVARGDIVSRPHATPIDEVLRTARHRSHVKRRLITAGLLDDRCAGCGIGEWRGQPLVLQLHHVNGVGDDHRLENLQLLCPNCHSQTENWGGRNRRRGAVPAPDATAP